MKLSGAEIIMECLLENGVDTVFGYPGGAVLDIYDAIYKYSDKITHIITSHEQGACHAADGYARATGKTGVVFATSGPGATNLVTGIATAYMDSVPLVAITGNVIAANLGRDSFQEIDIAGVTMPITKHNYIIKDISELAHAVREAFYIANSGRKGPVLIDVTKNVQVDLCEYERQELKKYAPKPVAAEKVREIIAALEKSKAPLILSGGGIISSGATKNLVEFAKRLDAGVCSTLTGLGGYPASDKNFLGMIGMHGTLASAKAYKNSDCLIAIGMRFSDRVALNRDSFGRDKTIIHIDIDTAELNKNIRPTLSLAADADEFLKTALLLLKKKDLREWQESLKEFKKEDFKNDNILAYTILTALSDKSESDQIVVTDVGQHQMWTAQHYKFEQPRTFLTSGGLGTMGYGLGAAIGAAVGMGKKIILITGDGCFHMNLNELATASKYGVPVKVFIMNNNALGMVRQWQKIFYGARYSHTTLNKNTNYKLVAEAFGCEAYTIDSKENVQKVIDTALATDSPSVINCILQSDDAVFPMVPAGKTFDDIILKKQGE